MASEGAIAVLKKLLAFDQDDRISAAEALKEPYFRSLFKSDDDDMAEPLSKLDYGFDQKTLRESEIRELMFREILEYHEDAKAQYMSTNGTHVYHFPSQVDRFKMQFMNLDNKGSSSSNNNMNRGGSGPTQQIKPAASLPNKGLPTGLMEEFASNNLSTSFSGATFDGGVRDILLAEDAPLSASFTVAKNSSFLGTSEGSQGGDKDLDNFKMMSLDESRGGS